MCCHRLEIGNTKIGKYVIETCLLKYNIIWRCGGFIITILFLIFMDIIHNNVMCVGIIKRKYVE